MSTTVVVPDPLFETFVIPHEEGWVAVWWDCSVYVGQAQVYQRRYYSQAEAFTRSISVDLVVEHAEDARKRLVRDFGLRLARVLAEA